jgi:hypothetical protein
MIRSSASSNEPSFSTIARAAREATSGQISRHTSGAGRPSAAGCLPPRIEMYASL